MFKKLFEYYNLSNYDSGAGYGTTRSNPTLGLNKNGGEFPIHIKNKMSDGDLDLDEEDSLDDIEDENVNFDQGKKAAERQRLANNDPDYWRRRTEESVWLFFSGLEELGFFVQHLETDQLTSLQQSFSADAANGDVSWTTIAHAVRRSEHHEL